jgi:hypothetical protein
VVAAELALAAVALAAVARAAVARAADALVAAPGERPRPAAGADRLPPSRVPAGAPP